MPRIANDTDALVKDLISRVERLIDVAKTEGREEALAEVRSVVGGASPRQEPAGRRTASSRGAKRFPKKAKPKKKPDGRKGWWDTATPAQKKARIRKMQAGRGLKSKS